MYDPEGFWEIISRCAFNEASDEEVQKLHEYFVQNPELQQYYEWVLQVLNNGNQRGTQNVVESSDSQNMVNRIFEKAATLEQQINTTSPKPKIKGTKRWWMAAALMGFGGLFSFFFLFRQSQIAPPITTLQTLKKVNKTQPSILPDGSKVWLNSGSELIFENDFLGKTREVKLIGEAYFDIKKDVTKPFIVHIDDVNIKVLGTAFNVKGYKEDNRIETSLYRGLVEVTKNGAKEFKPIRLHPNQKLSIPKLIMRSAVVAKVLERATAISDNIITVSPLDSMVSENENVETAWKYGRLEFKGELLEEVASKMEHWYHVKFVFADAAVRKLRFTGSFEKETLAQALRALQLANEFTYKINGDEVVIKSIQ